MRLLTGLAAICIAAGTASANSGQFGIASSYNVFSFSGLTDNSDIGGRVAAAGVTNGGMTIASGVIDSYSASAYTYTFYAGGGMSSGETINLGAGNAFAPGTNGNFNYNGGGSGVQHRDTSCGVNCINFSAAQTSLGTLSTQTLGKLSQTAGATIGADPQNPSRLLLSGTNSALNVFVLTAAQFNTNTDINIVVPAGATVVINVQGTNPNYGGKIFVNGNMVQGDDKTGQYLLFNFYQTTLSSTITLSGQFGASILAPYATLSASSQIDGNIIVNSVTTLGEVHDDLFAGTLPVAAPEPAPALLIAVGGGIIGVPMRRRKKY